MPSLDIGISSASRPEYLKQMLVSFKENFKFDDDVRFIFHEDCLSPDKLDEVLDIIESYDFDIIQIDNPPLGQPLSLNFLLQNLKADYYFNLEDDWVFHREIPANEVINLMEKYNDINQICFNKRGTFTEKHGWKKAEIKRDNTYLVTDVHWTLIPSIWRTSFIKKFWITPPKHCIIQWWLNLRIKQIPESERTTLVRYADWMMENVGAYFYGRFGEPSFIKHIGTKTTRSNAPNYMLSN